MRDHRRIVIPIETHARTVCVDITTVVQRALHDERVTDGTCHLYCPHTTAGLTINEGTDPHVAEDLVATLGRLVPLDGDYRHAEGNSDAHVKSTLTGVSLLVGVENGRLVLGRWQRVFFCEFDGPRHREVWAWFLGQ